MKPARKASPTPVGSSLAVSWAIDTSIGSCPATSTLAPRRPRVITRTPTRDTISSCDQPVFWVIRVSS